jgi:chromosome segregation ATPase
MSQDKSSMRTSQSDDYEVIDPSKPEYGGSLEYSVVQANANDKRSPASRRQEEEDVKNEIDKLKKTVELKDLEILGYKEKLSSSSKIKEETLQILSEKQMTIERLKGEIAQLQVRTTNDQSDKATTIEKLKFELTQVQCKSKNDQSQIQQKLTEKESAIKTLEKEIDSLRKEKTQISKSLADKEKQTASAEANSLKLTKKNEELTKASEASNTAKTKAQKDNEELIKQIGKLMQDMDSKSLNNQVDKKKETEMKETLEMQKKTIADQNELITQLAKSLEVYEQKDKDSSFTIKSQEEILKLQQNDIQTLIKEKDAAEKKVKELGGHI